MVPPPVIEDIEWPEFASRPLPTSFNENKAQGLVSPHRKRLLIVGLSLDINWNRLYLSGCAALTMDARTSIHQQDLAWVCI